MNIIIFIIFLVLILLLMIAGEILDPAFLIPAFGFLFILGFVVLNGSLQYKVGEEINQTYVYNADNVTINKTSEVRTTINANYTDTWNRLIGILICALSVGSFAIIYSHYAKGSWQRKEE